MHVKVKFVSLTLLELVALNPLKLQGHVTLATPFWNKYIQKSCRDYFRGMYAKFEVRSLSVLELLAFDAQKFKVSLSLAIA